MAKTKHLLPASGINETVGNRLRLLRTNIGLSRQALGEQIAVHHDSIRRAETGESRINLEYLFTSCVALGVDPVDVMSKDFKISNA